MLDDMLDYLERLREQPVWQPLPQEVRDTFRQPLDNDTADLAAVHDTFMKTILPYAVGNTHPGFMGWVHGGGTPVGMLAEMLAAGLNANLGGRDQAPVELERQLVQWIRKLFAFPETANGLFVTGTSMANLISVLIARTALLGKDVRQKGMTASKLRLVAYTSACAHISIAQAMDITGIGSDALRMIPVDAHYRMDVAALAKAIAADKKAGLTPFFIAATAGSADVGAIDPLDAIAEIARREKLWFHVDGAYGALAILASDIAPRLQGIERADSIAFDFHKWGQVPYDAGFILVRNGEYQLDTFASPAAYLMRATRGLAAGSPWPCDLGPELSRGFRALKTWFTIKVYGPEKLGRIISNTCLLAQYMKQRIESAPQLELLAPIALNIVCFRYRSPNADRINADIVIALQESGIAAPSTTTLQGRLAIRAAIVNHRTTASDIDALIDATLSFGEAAENNKKNDPTLRKIMTINDLQRATPTPLIGLAKLMRLAFSGVDLAPLGAQLIEHAGTDTSANTLMDLSTVLQLRGNRDLALLTQSEAIGSQQIYTPPTTSGSINIRVCAVMSSGDLMANTPLEFLLEDSDVALNLVYVTENQPLPAQLPEHDILFVAIAQSDQNMPLLKELNTALVSWPHPVLNQPARIALLSRNQACELLKAVPGVIMPTTLRMARQILEYISHRVASIGNYLEDGDYPIIVRPVDSHAGHGLNKIVDAEALDNYLQIHTDSEFYVSRFVDYRGHDGLFRKYRIVLIEGRPFICHLGISEHWMIHYLNAGMTENSDKRAEEADVMAAFDTGFAAKHRDAFRGIYERIGLDYLGIDCGETADGQLLIFEVDSCMIVHALDSVVLFPYKQPQMRKVFAAFRQMLINTQQRGIL